MDLIEALNVETAAALPPSDARAELAVETDQAEAEMLGALAFVTPAEYLERFDQQLAEDMPHWELPYWLREIHKKAGAAEKAFGMSATSNAKGTRTYHPHTLALAVSSIHGNFDVARSTASAGWLASNTAAPLFMKTAEERAACEPQFAWATLPEYIVDPFDGAASPVTY